MKYVRLPFVEQIWPQLKDGYLQVLLGARQVRKTTSLLQQLETTMSPDEYRYESFESLSSSVQRIDEIWDCTLENKLIVLDEIQKVNGWSDRIKSLWDANKRKGIKTRCILLGSSSLEIQQGLGESLTGRFELTRARHWNLKESIEGYGLDFDQYLRFGGYPGSYSLIQPIYKYSAKPITVKSSSPKLVVLAPALCTFARTQSLDADFLGRVFESLVGSDLIRDGHKLFYWRERNAEVDFVLKFEGDLVAVEVKSGRKKSAKGFSQFEKNFPKAKLILINYENYENFAKAPTAFLRKRLR